MDQDTVIQQSCKSNITTEQSSHWFARFTRSTEEKWKWKRASIITWYILLCCLIIPYVVMLLPETLLIIITRLRQHMRHIMCVCVCCVHILFFPANVFLQSLFNLPSKHPLSALEFSWCSCCQPYKLRGVKVHPAGMQVWFSPCKPLS